MKYIPKYLYKLIMCAAILSSCVDKQDFDQLDNLNVTPTAEASILYVETPERIINQVSGINFYSQTFNFDAFSEEFFADNVLDGVVTYEVENTTSKPLDITFEFLDDAGNSLDSENFTVNVKSNSYSSSFSSISPFIFMFINKEFASSFVELFKRFKVKFSFFLISLSKSVNILEPKTSK